MPCIWEPTAILSPVSHLERREMRDVMCSEDARTFIGAYNQAVAQDPMVARSEFLMGVRIPEATGR